MADGSMPDMGSLFGMAMELQQQMAAAQAALTATVVEGAAGGGAVKIEVTGGYEFRSVTIDPGVVDPDDVELLGDLVLAALHDAAAKVNALQEQTMNPMAGMDLASLDLGGLGGAGGLGDLGDLGGLLGLAPADPFDLDDEDDELEGEDDEHRDGRG